MAPRQAGGTRPPPRLQRLSKSIGLELEWVHLGDYALNPEDSFHYEGHDLLNVRASHQLTPGWEV